MSTVKLINVSKNYKGKDKAVDNVNLEINNKEFVVLVGPSGCGKSTTLRMIAGLEEISDGQIYIDGKLVNDIPPKDRDIAMVFQNYALYPHMTVYDNMAFGLKLRNFSKDEIKERVNYAAKILEIEELLNKKPKHLSGGQRQRVAVGRAIVRKPKVFLFDEPLSNLDAKLRVQMRAEIKRLHQRIEATIIYVTHDQVEAMTMGDRIVVMKDGIIQQVDSPLNLYNNPANKFVAGFIGSPAMNFIPGKIMNDNGLKFVSRGNSLIITFDEIKKAALASFLGKDVVAGIRPESLSTNPVGQAKVMVNVDVVEQLGNESFLYFQFEDSQFVARTLPNNLIGNAGKITLYINDNSVLFFSEDRNERIYF